MSVRPLRRQSLSEMGKVTGGGGVCVEGGSRNKGSFLEKY